MTIIKSLEKIKNIENSVVTIGNFDGIHKGHIQLIKRTVDQAKKKNFKSVIFTFENHPMRYFRANSIKNLRIKNILKMLSHEGIQLNGKTEKMLLLKIYIMIV